MIYGFFMGGGSKEKVTFIEEELTNNVTNLRKLIIWKEIQPKQKTGEFVSQLLKRKKLYEKDHGVNIFIMNYKQKSLERKKCKRRGLYDNKTYHLQLINQIIITC